MSTTDEIEKLADRVVADALADGIKLADRVDALKTLKDIYAVLMKHREKHPPDEDDNDFNGFRKQIDAADEQQAVHGRLEGAKDAGTKVRGRRGHA